MGNRIELQVTNVCNSVNIFWKVFSMNATILQRCRSLLRICKKITMQRKDETDTVGQKHQ